MLFKKPFNISGFESISLNTSGYDIVSDHKILSGTYNFIVRNEGYDSVTGKTNIRIGFEADFENNVGANNADKWNANSVSPGKHDFKIEDGWLTQSLDTCDNATTTLLPVDSADWTDYTVAVDIRRRGDLGDANDAKDTVSVTYRYV